MRDSRKYALMRRAAQLMLAAVLSSSSHSLLADPYEADPGAAARDVDYAAAKEAMAKQRWRDALTHLGRALMRDPDNADLHNYLGFTYRKLGQLDNAFKYYRRAIELNPRHRGAHEYIGEAYLMANNVAKAREHLAALEKICLLPCEELDDLRQKIAAHQARASSAPSQRTR